MSKKLDVERSAKFSEYVHGLKDPVGKAKILSRLKRLENGNWGDVGPIGDGLSELVIDYGPGYRVYCKRVGDKVVVLGGGTKNRQQADIDAAKADAKLL
ncbi:type II toxin-antitoxin system RelE/ParE family toxin [Acidovorax sp. LjRoot74]|uniref:type II toxin-antitoxin system RelE/ParE family toxin n=1 Tax=Acidovorax sp. LjRoot74 TaxID=3342337 RepID=UPI003ECD79C0